MPKPFTIHCLSTVVSPLTHMEGSEGNRSVCKRAAVFDRDAGVTRMVPAITGNALRSSALRRPGMDWLIDRAGLAGHLIRPEAYFLLTGGAEYEGGGRESMQLIAKLAEACPLAGVLGGVTPNQIFSGSVLVDIGVLICRENAWRLPTFLPDGCDLPEGRRLKPAAEWIGEYQYYRHDHDGGVAGRYGPESDSEERAKTYLAADPKNRPAGPADTPLKGERAGRDKVRMSSSMPFSGECVVPGAAFAHRIQLLHPTRLEVGAVLFSLRLWAERGNRVGGMAARGHGLLSTRVHWNDPEYAGADDEYAAHVLGKSDALRDWLAAAFRAKPPGEGKPAKGKAKKPAADLLEAAADGG